MFIHDAFLYFEFASVLKHVAKQEIAYGHSMDSLIIAFGKAVEREDEFRIIILNTEKVMVFAFLGFCGIDLLGYLNIDTFILLSCDKINLLRC
jgi:hypothetical protein